MYLNNRPVSSDHAVSLNWCNKCMPQPVSFSSQLCENHLGTAFDGLSVNPNISNESTKLNFDLLAKFDIDPDLCFDTTPEQKDEIKSTMLSFSDMVYTDDNNLVICSSGTRTLQSRRARTSETRNSQKLLKYGEKGKYTAQCLLEGSPRKICLLSEGEAVVTLGQKIQFVDVRDMSPGKSILIGSDCSGIATVKNMIYVGDSSKIHVLDRIGRLYKTIKSPCALNSIHLSIDGRLYCTTGIAVCCLSLDGTLIYSYNSSQLGGVHAVTSDKHGHIYVAGGELQIIYPHKSKIDRVFHKDEGLGPIKAICFNEPYTKMFIANDDGKSITVFTCK